MYTILIVKVRFKKSNMYQPVINYNMILLLAQYGNRNMTTNINH